MRYATGSVRSPIRMLMNRHAASLLSPGPLVLAGLIALAALSRVLPHPPNFSPVAAVALFAGAYFAALTAVRA